MKSTTISLSVLALGALALAQDYNQSAPFYLVSKSHNSPYNDVNFGACHTGAAIESVCVGGNSTFQLNTTSDASVGILTYTIPNIVSEPLSLSTDISSNVALPIFQPSYSYLSIGFDSDSKMYMLSYLDDTVAPPKALSEPKKLYRWYVCETYYGGYSYKNLAWVLGNKPPQNPSCVKVSVVRKAA